VVLLKNRSVGISANRYFYLILALTISISILISSIHTARSVIPSDVPEIQSSIQINNNNSFATCFTPDMNYHVYGAWDNDTRIHFIDISGDPERVGGGNFNLTPPEPCSIVKITGDGRYLTAGGGWADSYDASNIYLFNITNRTLVKSIEVAHQYFEISPDGEYLAVIDNRTYTSIYRTSDNSIFKKFSRDIGLLTFSHDGQYLSAFNSSDNGSMSVFMFPEMTPVFNIEGTPNFTLSPNREGIIAWSPEGDYAAVIIASKNEVKIIDSNIWKVERTFVATDENFHFNFVSFSPEGGFLAVGGSTIESPGVSLGLQIYNTEDWKRVHNEPNEIDYSELVKHNNIFEEEYLIFDSFTWLDENRLYLSATKFPGTIELNLEIEADDEPDDASPEGLALDDVDYVLIVGTGVSIIIILSIFGMLSHLGLLPNPLYTKLKPDEVKNQETRNNIFSFIHEHPGCNFSDIKKSVQRSNSNVYYHISVLEREDVIFSKFSGIKKQFYSSSYPRISRTFPAKEDQSIHEKIYLLLEDQPGLTQKEIAVRLNISEPTVSRYVLDLMTENFIRREKDGNVWKCYANKDE
jgi:predicted transcriptional regulator/WD40 repeat protein